MKHIKEFQLNEHYLSQVNEDEKRGKVKDSLDYLSQVIDKLSQENINILYDLINVQYFQTLQKWPEKIKQTK